MNANELARVQSYLRGLFANEHIVISPPMRPNAPVEVLLAGEFIGVLDRDEDEGEVSYAFTISILEEDLQPVA